MTAKTEESLFQEYVDLVQEDPDDPRLKEIECALQNMELEIKIPEDGREEFSKSPLGDATNYIVSICLIRRPSGAIVEVAENILVSFLDPPTSHETAFDKKFLKYLGAKW